MNEVDAPTGQRTTTFHPLVPTSWDTVWLALWPCGAPRRSRPLFWPRFNLLIAIILALRLDEWHWFFLTLATNALQCGQHASKTPISRKLITRSMDYPNDTQVSRAWPGQYIRARFQPSSDPSSSSLARTTHSTLGLWVHFMRSISAVLYLLFVRHLGSINSHPNPLKPSQTIPQLNHSKPCLPETPTLPLSQRLSLLTATPSFLTARWSRKKTTRSNRRDYSVFATRGHSCSSSLLGAVVTIWIPLLDSPIPAA